jgi:hypothetical protein
MSNSFTDDGDIVAFSTDIVIGGTTYPTEDFKFDQDVTRILSKNSKGQARGKIVINNKDITGSFTAIYPASATVAPAFGSAFSFTKDGITYPSHIEKVGHSETNVGETKLQCTFSVDIGTVTVT